MATAMKKTTKKTVDDTMENLEDIELMEADTPVENESIEVKEQPAPKKTKKKFAPDDEIPCLSIFPGQYFVKGERSGDLYTFANIDDVQYLRFDDLDYLVKRNKPCVFRPRFIVQDSDFLELYPKVEAAYGSLYSTADLKAILKLPANQMKAKIKTLPIGARESLKTIASTQVDRGALDSVQRVKALDEVFGTSMLARITGAFN